MKTCIFADIHLKNKDQFGKQINFNGLRVEERSLYKIKRMKEIILQEKPDCLIIAGDLWDTSQPSEILRALFFKTIPSLASKVFYVCGNHDMENLFPSGLSESQAFQNFVIIPAKQWSRVGNIDMIGWTRNDSEFISLCRKNTFLVSHRDISQMELSYNYIFYGHNHVHKQEGKFFSIGSLFKDDWAEEGIDHKYMVIEDDKFEFKTNPDLQIRSFDGICRSTDEINKLDAIRFIFKGKASALININEKEIRKNFDTKVFFKYEIEEEKIEIKEENIQRIMNDFLSDKNLNKDELEFGSKMYQGEALS